MTETKDTNWWGTKGDRQCLEDAAVVVSNILSYPPEKRREAATVRRVAEIIWSADFDQFVPILAAYAEKYRAIYADEMADGPYDVAHGNRIRAIVLRHAKQIRLEISKSHDVCERAARRAEKKKKQTEIRP